MRKTIFLILAVCACKVQKVDVSKIEPDVSTVVQDSVKNKELQDFKEVVCPAAFNGLRVMNQEQVVDQKNFRDTTIMENLEEAFTMLVIIVKECTSDPAHDTILVPKKFEGTQDSHISPTLLALR